MTLPLFTVNPAPCDRHDDEPATTIAGARLMCQHCAAEQARVSGWLSIRWLGEPPEDHTITATLSGLVESDDYRRGVADALRWVIGENHSSAFNELIA